MKRKHNYDETYFDEINTPEKAYFLGLLYADGCNHEHPTTGEISISLQIEDRCVVDKLKEEMKSDYPLLIRKDTNENHEDQIRFYVYGKHIAESLEKQGCVKRKTKNLSWPTEWQVPEDLISHFMRGYFDGDGCIWNGKRKKMWVNDPTRKEGRRERIIHNVKFNITGYVSFISAYQQYLIDNLGFKQTKLNSRRINSDICTMEYSGRQNIKKFYDFIYKDATVFLPRKKKKFEEIICALNEKSLSETELIAGTPEMVISSQASSNEVEGSSTTPEMVVEASASECSALNE